MNKKGFTLIELLAVILILGIIALIAIPTVNNILKESKLGAFKASVQNIVKAAEEKCLTESMKGNTLTQFTFSGYKVTPELDVKGELPKSGFIRLNENCEAIATLTNGDFKYVLNYEEAEIDECTGNSCSFSANITEEDPKYSCYNFDKETGTILKYDGANPSCQGDVYIPAMIDGVPVVKLHPLSFNNPEKIFCEKDGVKTEHDPSYIPKNDDGYCYGMKYPENFNYNVLDMNDAGYLEEIGDDAFYDTGLTEIKFNDNLKKIGIYSFGGLNTKKIVLPKNLEDLGDLAFEYSNIEELVINENLKVIGEYAFEGHNLKEINIPEGVEYIEEGAFAYTDDESNEVVVNLPNSLIGIGGWAFEVSNVKKIKFGNKINYIGDYAFAGNLITKIEFPSSLRQLGEGSFANNKLTENVFIYNLNSDGTENKKSLNSYAGAATNIVLPNEIEILGNGALVGGKITSITLNEGLKSIGAYMHSSDTITTITIPSTVETIHTNALYKHQYRNPNLTTIINKTGRSFEWGSITNSTNKNQVFEVGTIEHDYGEIQVTK